MNALQVNKNGQLPGFYIESESREKIKEKTLITSQYKKKMQKKHQINIGQ